MYLIGIDIFKFKHDCFIATEHGQVIKKTFSFSNDFRILNDLLVTLKFLDKSGEIQKGLKVTGHYGSNLIFFTRQWLFIYVI